MVVDDLEPLRRLVSVGMRASGFAVWAAGSGQEAIELYQCHRDAIDVVLLDVQMPDRDGPDTVAALRELDPHVRFCFMSADPGNYTEDDLLALGAVAVFRKPFRMRELAQTLERVAAPVADREPYDRWEDDGGRA